WDAQSAEALTRVYEMAQAEDAAGRQPRRARAPGKPRQPVQAAPTSPHAPSPAYDQAWLEARFAGIAALLQQSLSDCDPAKSRAQPAGLRDDAIAALIDTAAERAATRLASAMPAAMPAPEVGGGTRIDALEGLMQDYIAERRRGEETTTGMLHTIEDALVRIM